MKMKNHLYEDIASGVLLHVEYHPATDTSSPQIGDIHVADNNYRPTGPSLTGFLHNTFLLDTRSDPAVATRVLEDIAQDLPK
jgi:hypothetical protein